MASDVWSSMRGHGCWRCGESLGSLRGRRGMRFATALAGEVIRVLDALPEAADLHRWIEREFGLNAMARATERALSRAIAAKDATPSRMC